MHYTYYIADAFTRQIFGGAQIAVFPDAEGLDQGQMALIARELNLSETVFLTRQDKDGHRFRMKLFSPLGEVNFAGHPIIAAGYVLIAGGILPAITGNTPVIFEQNTGAIQANITISDGQPVFVQFTRSVEPVVDYYAPTEAELACFLNIDPAHIDSKKYMARLVACDAPYLVVPVYYYQTLRTALFDFSAWSQSIAPQTAAQEILLLSRKTPYQDADFAARLLGPNIGPHDDPPIGAAIPALAGYLCSFAQLQKGTYTFAVQRGDDKTRRSVLHLEMDHKGGDALTLRVGGDAVIVAKGELYVPDI